MAELTVSVAKAIAEGQGATAWEIYQLARAFLHEHGMESPPYVEHAALSHAAGQDGEQCRAASDVPFDTVRKVVSALSRLGVSYPVSKEEQAARSVELVNDLCREVHAHLDNLRALSRGVPEGMLLNAARYDWLRDSASRIEWNGCYTYSPGYTAHDADLMDQAIDAAIAAQRKGLDNE